MKEKEEFSKKIAKLQLSVLEMAVAFLWYYRFTQLFEERTANELAEDLKDVGLCSPNPSRLKSELSKTKYTIKGKRPNTFQISLKKLNELNDKYEPLIKLKQIKITKEFIPQEWVTGTRPYLENLVEQINGTFEYEFYDGCGVLCRRLMESLIIECFISNNLKDEIMQNGHFRDLSQLILTISNHQTIILGRDSPKTMKKVKELGDTSAHDRTYITHMTDLEDIKGNYRKLITDLLDKAKIRKI